MPLKSLLFIFFLWVPRQFVQCQTGASTTSAHDPVMIKQGDRYYVFCTGPGITVYSSADMKNWNRQSPVFTQAPAWALKTIPGFKGHIWAPDISYHNGQFYLYYAVSAFGKNTSAIGLAINKTLDTTSADFNWKNMGLVVQSVPGRDMWNAIDPNLIIDDKGTGWLTFGSFWNGLKLVKLNDSLNHIAQPEVWYTIAARTRKPGIADSLAGDAAIEAPFIFKQNGYYYLFASWDFCCQGEKSTYKVVVGRSKQVEGPYLDKTGNPMWNNGGTLVVQGDKTNWFGAGHNAAYTIDGNDYMVLHAYDAHNKGKPKLVIVPLRWDDDGWPLAINADD